jgi:excisionase family DNA binding protein
MSKIPTRQNRADLHHDSTSASADEGEADCIPKSNDRCAADSSGKSRWPCELEPLVVSPKIAQRLLGVGPTKLYELIQSGELESYLDGGSRRILYASIKARVARLRETAPEVDGASVRGGSVLRAAEKSVAVRRSRKLKPPRVMAAENPSIK